MVIDKVVALKQEVLASTPPPRRKRKKGLCHFCSGEGRGEGDGYCFDMTCDVGVATKF